MNDYFTFAPVPPLPRFIIEIVLFITGFHICIVRYTNIIQNIMNTTSIVVMDDSMRLNS